MKVACPNCRSRLDVPDEWSGRVARCPRCKAPFTVPDAAKAQDQQAAGEAPSENNGIDLDALAALEPGGLVEPVLPKDVPPPKRPKKRAKGAPPSAPSKPQVVRTPDGKIFRICPHCGHQIKVEEVQTEVLCGNCWKTVPALTESEETHVPEGQTLIGGLARTRGRTVGFYDGLMLAFGYPVGSLNSIAVGTLVATGIILVPTLLLMGIIGVMRLEPVYGHEIEVPEWIRPAIVITLLAELVYFAGVGYYALIDSIRSTLSGSEKPPELVWNLTTVTNSLISYMGFLLFYASLATAGFWLIRSEPLSLPTSLEDFQELLTPGGLVLLAVLTFFVPMTIIGMGMGRGLQGLNPIRTVQSILGTISHYIFLYCIVLVYASLYGVAVAVMLDYSGKSIMDLVQHGIEQGVPRVVLGVVAWGLLVGVGFYGQIVLGRILGLFARTFERHLAFES